MKALADYLLLPKELVAAIEQHKGAREARSAYTKALGAYNLTTSFDKKPRIYDFVMKEELLAPLMRECLRAMGEFELIDIDGEAPVMESHDLENCSLQWLIDGVFGEPLSEYGYAPSSSRLQLYSASCVMVRRKLPIAALPKEVPEDAGYLNGLDEYDQDKIAVLCSPEAMAAALGKVDVLEKLRAHGRFDKKKPKTSTWRDIIKAAARFGQRAVIEWCAAQVPSLWTEGGGDPLLACKASLEWGQFELSRWLIDTYKLRERLLERPKHAECTCRDALNAAARRNDVDGYKWLLTFFGPNSSIIYNDAIALACEHKNRELVELAVGAGAQVTRADLFCALEAGDLDIYNYLASRKASVDGGKACNCTSLLAGATIGFAGRGEILTMLVSQGETLDEEAVRALVEEAAERGHVQALEWLRRQPGFEKWAQDPTSPLFGKGLALAVLHGRTAVVDWLVAQAEANLKQAKAAGTRIILDVSNLSVPKSTGPSVATVTALAPYYDLSQLYFVSMAKQDVALARWLFAQGLAIPPLDPREAILDVIELGDKGLPMLRCLVKECGLKLDEYEGWPGSDRDDTHQSCAAARSGSVRMMKAVLSQGCATNNSSMDVAAQCGHLPLLRWLRAKNPRWKWPMDIVVEAMGGGFDEVVTWLSENGAEDDFFW